jgi:hypothetical protein
MSLRATAKRAIEFRFACELAFDSPCDIYEVIRQRDVELQFVDIPSLEGMYLEEPETCRICVSAHRPVGRQRFTAAHELGHHILRHGSQFDTVVDELDRLTNSSTEEAAADAFARYVLMPPRAVQAAFRLRGFELASLEPLAVYRAACWLGVGYITLLNQMLYSLRVLDPSDHERLSRTTPKSIKAELAGVVPKGDVWPLDEFWEKRRLHTQIGDFIVGLKSQASAPIVTETDRGLYVARNVGESVLPLAAGGNITLCVSKSAYVGFYDYRYLVE